MLPILMFIYIYHSACDGTFFYFFNNVLYSGKVLVQNTSLNYLPDKKRQFQ